MWLGKISITTVLADYLNCTNWVAGVKKILIMDASKSCMRMAQRGIVIFLCGAYIYIFLHGFRIELKLSPGVSASGEFNLL